MSVLSLRGLRNSNVGSVWVSNYKQIIPIVLGILLGLSVLIVQTGILKGIDLRFYTVVSQLTYLLKVLIVVLAWRHYRKTGCDLFKWLAVSMGISVFLIIKTFVYRYLITPSGKTWGLELLRMIQQINTSISLGCGIIIALLMVYALYNYRAKTPFFSVFKPVWLAVLMLIWIGLVITSLIQGQGHSEFLYLPLQIAEGLIYFYGLKTSIKLFNLERDNLFRWFTWIFIFYLIPIILALISIGFIPFASHLDTGFFVFHSYLIMTFISGGPLLITAFLIKYRAGEPIGTESGKAI